MKFMVVDVGRPTTNITSTKNIMNGETPRKKQRTTTATAATVSSPNNNNNNDRSSPLKNKSPPISAAAATGGGSDTALNQQLVASSTSSPGTNTNGLVVSSTTAPNSSSISNLNQHPVTTNSIDDKQQQIVSSSTEMNVQLQAHLQQLMLQNQLLTLIQQQQQSQQQQQQLLQQRVSHFLTTPLAATTATTTANQTVVNDCDKILQTQQAAVAVGSQPFLAQAQADSSQQQTSGQIAAAILPLLAGQPAQQLQPQLNLGNISDLLLRCGVAGVPVNLTAKLPVTQSSSTATSNTTPLAAANQIASQFFQSPSDPGSVTSASPSGLYAHGVCRWPGCETICEGPDAFASHLSSHHPPDEKAAAQTCVQAQIVQQLEEQLTREKRRFEAMMSYLQLAKSAAAVNTASSSVFANLSGQNAAAQLSNFIPGSSSQLALAATANPSSVSAIAAAANLLAAAFPGSIVSNGTAPTPAPTSTIVTSPTVAPSSSSADQQRLMRLPPDSASSSANLSNTAQAVSSSLNHTMEDVDIDDSCQSAPMKKSPSSSNNNSSNNNGNNSDSQAQKRRSSDKGSAVPLCTDIERNREFYRTRDIRPPYTYASLIRQAIIESQNKQLTLNEIYQWFQMTFAYFRRNEATWKNAVRHNLSLHKCFMRVENVKGAVWTVDDGEFYKRRSAKMSLSPLRFKRPGAEEANGLTSGALFEDNECDDGDVDDGGDYKRSDTPDNDEEELEIGSYAPNDAGENSTSVLDSSASRIINGKEHDNLVFSYGSKSEPNDFSSGKVTANNSSGHSSSHSNSGDEEKFNEDPTANDDDDNQGSGADEDSCKQRDSSAAALKRQRGLCTSSSVYETSEVCIVSGTKTN